MTWREGVRTSIAVPVAVGCIALVLGFGGFGAWAAIAPLEGAVIAQGTVTASGRNKIVQHLEGGIVEQILVQDGDRVDRDQPLVIFNATAAEATRNRLKDRLAGLAALEGRALAERAGADQIIFSEELRAQASVPQVARIIEDEEAEFSARRQRHQAELQMLHQQIAGLREETLGFLAQQRATELELELILEEKADSEALLAKALLPKSRVMELRRAEAELVGQGGQLTASIAKANQLIAEKQQEVQRLGSARIEEASAILREARSQQSDLDEQLSAAEDTLRRIVLRSPDSGIVVNLAQIDTGGVLAPGQRIMDIVPEAAELIVEAHIRPRDVDQVHVGQNARLAFSALDPREVPQVPAVVTYISADRLESERTGEVYYTAHLAISAAPLSGFDPTQVRAGHPVEVYVTTGERSFLAYITDPLANTVRRAFRE